MIKNMVKNELDERVFEWERGKIGLNDGFIDEKRVKQGLTKVFCDENGSKLNLTKDLMAKTVQIGTYERFVCEKAKNRT